MSDELSDGLACWLASIGDARGVAALSELLPDAVVFIVDADRHIVHWSDGASRILGFSADEVLGEHCLKANRCPQCMRGCGLSERGSISGAPITLHRKDGTALDATKFARGFFDADGRFMGGIEVLRPASRGQRVAHDAVDLVAEDRAMVKVCRLARVAAELGCPVLIRGERGAGKSSIADAICRMRFGSTTYSTVVQADALSREVLQRELVGWAAESRPENGALILEDLGRLGTSVEDTLRLLVSRSEASSVGADGHAGGVHLIVTTSERQTGLLDDESWTRLGGMVIAVPALRHRRADIPPLVAHFVAQLRGGDGTKVSVELLKAMMMHRWPGNVAQLREVLAYAVVVAKGSEIRLGDVPPDFHAVAEDDESEADRIRAALEKSDGHIGRAAEHLQMSRPTLWRKRKKLGI